jgi:hypothetical protein
MSVCGDERGEERDENNRELRKKKNSYLYTVMCMYITSTMCMYRYMMDDER